MSRGLLMADPCETRWAMTERTQDPQIAQLNHQVSQLSKQVRLNRALALCAVLMVLCLLATGQKANAPRKLVTQELSMVDEDGNEWAVFGLDGNRRRGLHLFGGGIGDIKSSPGRSQPLLSLIGNYVAVIDPRDHAVLSLNPTRIEMRTGDARAELSVYHAPQTTYIDTPPPRRAVSAGLFLTAGDGHSVHIVGANSSSPAVGIVSPDNPAIVIERRVSSPPGALTRMWSAPPIPEATDEAP